MPYEVTRIVTFSGAHRLRGYEGRCEALHGHNWRIEATVAGDRLDNAGMLIDFKLLKKILEDVVDPLDHRDLNDVPPFDSQNPTAENIARHIAEQTAQRLPDGVRLTRVRVWETDGSAADYIP